jgi:hypothetical protein
MIYETVEVVDSDERVVKLEQQQKDTTMHMKMLDSTLSQITEIKIDNAIKDAEIKRLKKMFERVS